MKYPPRAAFNAFSACQAIRIFDKLAQPGIIANIYADWAIKRTNPALDAPFRVRDDVPGYQGFDVMSFIADLRGHIVTNFLTYYIPPKMGCPWSILACITVLSIPG
jgi:hypothetical protein